MMSFTFGLFTQVSDSGPHGYAELWLFENFSISKISAIYVYLNKELKLSQPFGDD